MLRKKTIELLIFCIGLYKKFISPILPNCCRFYPTCSDYAVKSLKKFGVVKGSIYSIYRILRCNPFCRGGIDDIN
ncbi:MAG TPA: membrane protein insertion efficiency factor YidD [bacterium]|nr:membrane protein insertion efficiency factor YidD [bacterium]HPP86616.1 membrane protein insertion efficiency factor YidD [bacterium]